MEEWVELRVHGVSGTPPESLLGVARVEQVAGDDYSRFFRPVDAPHDGHVLEGYHWGRFTSGTWRQGLALLLVPFGLVNAAQFMLPRRGDGYVQHLHRLASASLRVLALVLTALFSFTLGLILIDLVAWRWAPDSGLLGRLPIWALVPAGAGVAAVALMLLALLGRSGAKRTPRDTDAREPPGTTDLNARFFATDPDAPAMRAMHLAAGLTVIAVLLARTRRGDEVALPLLLLVLVTAAVVALGGPERMDRTGATTWRRHAGRALCALSVVALIAEGWQTGRELAGMPSDATRSAGLYAFDAVANWLMVAAVVALGVLHTANVLLVWRVPGRAEWTRSDAIARLGVLAAALLAGVLVLLTRPDPWVTVLAGIVVLCTVVLAAVAIRYAVDPPQREPRPDERAFRPFAGGMTPFLLATLGTFIGVGLSAAAANAVAAALPAEKGSERATTAMLERVGFAWGLTASVVLALGLALLVHYCVSRGSYRRKVREDFGDTLPPGWPDRVARAMFAARLKHRAPIAVIVFAAVGLLISGVQVFESFRSGTGVESVPLIGWLSEPRTADSGWIIGAGTWLLVGAAGYLVAVSRGAIKSSELRRGINVVWDVFSFWPHAVHPFVPRPYSRWTVIELRNRIRFHLRGGPGRGAPVPETSAPGRKVVVAAHSQGSLIAYAALLMLEPHEQKRVAFLSCGSQLRVIYPRAFPAYVNLATHEWLFERLGGAWINLYRATDPLAGPVLSWAHEEGGSRHLPRGGPSGAEPGFRRFGNDWRLIDPIPHDPDVETGAVSAIHGHHDFWGDPSWASALAELKGDDGRSP